MRAYSISMQAVEQTLVSIARESLLPDPSSNLLSDYMKNTLHLYQKDYTFQQTKLKLQHIDIVWRYLEKLLILCQGKWTSVPNTIMDCYMKSVNDTQNINIKQFIVQQPDLDKLWLFLSAIRRFIKDMCKTELTQTPENKSLYEYLGNAEDIDEDLVYQFCGDYDLKLSQIGDAYTKAAEEYQKLLNEQQNN